MNLKNRPDWEFSPDVSIFSGDAKIPFKKIIVEDFRFDTTKLGYIDKGTQKRITCKNGIANELTRILNLRFRNNLDSNSERTLVIVLKHLWLQQGATDLDNEDKIVRRDLYYGPDKSAINFSDFEIYSKENEKYKALIKLSGEFTAVKYKPKKLDDLLLLSFDSAFRKISGINANEVLKNKKEYAFDFIRDNYVRRFNLPILTIQTLTRGVFLTFDDFKKNKTNHPDFTWKTNRLTDELYVGAGDSQRLLTDFWGFCDGQKLFIRLGFNFFELVRQNNTFDLYGAKYVTNVTGYESSYPNGNGYSTPVHQRSNSYKLEYKPLQVDMEEGDVY